MEAKSSLMALRRGPKTPPSGARDGAEFMNAARESKLKRWPILRCGICNAWHDFVFEGDEVKYDVGCLCRGTCLKPSSWDEVADHYNIQSNPHLIREMDAQWGFTPGQKFEVKEKEKAKEEAKVAQLSTVASHRVTEFIVKDEETRDLFTVRLPENWNIHRLAGACSCPESQGTGIYNLLRLNVRGPLICSHVHHVLNLPVSFNELRRVLSGVITPLPEALRKPEFRHRF